MRSMVGVAVAAMVAAGPPAAARTPKPAPVPALVAAVSIPYQTFTLDNGLRVVVHTDRKTPVVAVSVWYGVGSADEPKGKTGFAHLFEHLMFNGSGNWDGEFFEPLEDVGATSYNGTTGYDRTNYFQNVPTGALDLALFLEADRMGNLLPAVTQAKLDNQRGVVQNEKRQGDNEPYGLTFYALAEGLFPEGHPYRHATIGSMTDLDNATLEDVRNWFSTHYGPNNAVLVLAGDIDVATAKAKVTRYFGAIPRGPEPPKVFAPLPRGTGGRTLLRDRVPNARLILAWAVPDRNDPVEPSLAVAAHVLGNGASSRLYNDLVRDRQWAVGVSGSVLAFELASIFLLSVDVKPGVDPARVEQRLDELLAAFRAKGPTADEVRRATTSAVASRIRGLEQVGGFGGKAVALAEGMLYSNDPGFYRVRLERLSRVTPASVRAAARDWLGSPGFRLLTLPGERGPAELALVGEAGAAATGQSPKVQAPDRSKLPPVERREGFDFPAIERTTLANGIPVTFARRSAVPVVEVLASFDAGNAADLRAKPGTQALMLNLLKEGTTSRTGRAIVEESERLGARIGVSAGLDRTRVSLSALVPNLEPSLRLMADIVRNPVFAPAEVDRLRAIQLSAIAQEEANPGALAARALGPRIYGADHPYALPASGLGTAEGVRAVTREDLIDFHARWIRPDTVEFFVVGDVDQPTIIAALEQAFGDWPAPARPRGLKASPPMRAPEPARILLIDRPNSPQSFIAAGQPIPVSGADDRIDLEVANEALGGSFTSRLNLDLRETKGWSYGVRSLVPAAQGQMTFQLRAPVQADRTGDSLRALIANIEAFAGREPVAPADLARIINSNIYALPGTFETSTAVLAALERMRLFNWPDDYFETLAPRYRALDRAAITRAAAGTIDPKRLQWVVVGDARVVLPQLEALGLPLEIRRAP